MPRPNPEQARALLSIARTSLRQIAGDLTFAPSTRPATNDDLISAGTSFIDSSAYQRGQLLTQVQEGSTIQLLYQRLDGILKGEMLPTTRNAMDLANGCLDLGRTGVAYGGRGESTR